jgi:hypothetical protein
MSTKEYNNYDLPYKQISMFELLYSYERDYISNEVSLEELGNLHTRVGVQIICVSRRQRVK